MIVVDASVLVDFLLGRPQAVAALADELPGDGQEPLHAPDLIEPEALNALRRLALSRTVDDTRATTAATEIGDVRMLRHPHAPLRGRIWELRHQLTAYDATYLALAEALDARLLTADLGLAQRARTVLGEERVRHIA